VISSNEDNNSGSVRGLEKKVGIRKEIILSLSFISYSKVDKILVNASGPFTYST